MAECSVRATSSSYSPQIKLTVTNTSSTSTDVTLSYTLQYIASSAASTSSAREYSVVIDGTTVRSSTFDINGKTGTHTICTGTKTINRTQSTRDVKFSFSFAFKLTWSGEYSGTKTASNTIPVAALPTYTISYNANGGSGAPSNQTKVYGTTLKLSSTKPTKTGSVFKGWDTSSGATTVVYSAGGNYTANAAATLYAVWQLNTYKVTFNANGGSGGPTSQTKSYGVSLTLSNSIPTRAGYVFQGWGTSSSTTTVSYSPGGTYTGNAAITLYAIWKLAYTVPKISGVSAYRCDSTGANEDDYGTFAKVTFTWSCFDDGESSPVEVSSAVVRWKTETGLTWQSKSVTVSGNWDTSSTVIGSSDETSSEYLNPEESYIIEITVTDSSSNNPNYSTYTDSLSTAKYPIDLLYGGGGVAIGKAARYEDMFEVAYPTKLLNGLLELPIITGTALTGENIDFNELINCGKYTVRTNAIMRTISNRPCDAAGSLYVFNPNTPSKTTIDGAYQYLIQLYAGYDGSVYIRNIQSTSTDGGVTWSISYGNWFLFNGVETGTTLYGWKYQKWNDGRIKLWYIKTVNTAISTEYGNGYYYGPVTVNFDSGLITSIENIQVTAQRSIGGLVGSSIRDSSTSNVRIYITAFRSESAADVSLHIEVTGRWR